MKRERAFRVCISLGIWLSLATVLFFFGRVPVKAKCGDSLCAEPPCCNGDVNGDEQIDITDAIYLLSHLFLGGPAPETINAPPCNSCCPPGGLPATGQTLCYDAAGNVVDCESEGFPGQDGYYQAGCPLENRFELRTVNDDEVVIDHCTGLMWQKDTAPGTYTWQGALQYCENLDLAGNTDWRLPNVLELFSLVDHGRVGPAIDPVFSDTPAGGAPNSWYWTSTTRKPMYAKYISFTGGGISIREVSERWLVRAVRNAQ